GAKRLLVACVVSMGVMGVTWAMQAQAEEREPTIEPGMQCLVNDGWWSLDHEHPVQTEPVRVIKVQALPSAEPGVWVQPLRGPLTGHQYQIALERLNHCKP